MDEKAKSVKAHTIVWQNISIDITYNSDWSKPYQDVYGDGLAHLELRSRHKERLPMTKTGYYSLFIPAPEIEHSGGPEQFVLDWLDHTSRSRAWQAYMEDSKQLSLL